MLDALLETLALTRKSDELKFQSNGELTLGVELEVQLINPKDGELIPKSEALLGMVSDKARIKPEIFTTMLEINTGKQDTVQQIEQDLGVTIAELLLLGNTIGVDVASTGCHPTARYTDALVYPSRRYNELIDRNQWLSRRIIIFGLHVHMGMRDGDQCIRYNNFLLYFIPHLIALSASSPFWQGEDTGLSACRPSIFEALPTAGQPYQVKSWTEFEQLYQTLMDCKSITSLKDLWWDMRPSPGFGTLEVRVCDGTATLSETVAVVAFIHLLAHWFRDHVEWIESFPPPSRWLSRENKWRAMRHGMEAAFLVSIDGKTKLLKDDITDWLTKLESYTEKLGYQEYVQTIRDIITHGNSSTRQRKVFESTGDLKAVVRHNAAEFAARKPIFT